MKKSKINRLFIYLFANCFITGLFLLTACSYEASAKEVQAPKVIVKNNEGKDVTLELNKLDVNVKIVGNLAVTTMDMSFSNSFPKDGRRQYEGTLLFPLSEGQSICRLAMEINGHLREGVIVEKEKGRVVFEDVERRKVDPALLEMTSSNNYKLRVYPILPEQNKRIVIAYEEILNSDESAMMYNLPLNYGGKIPELSITANVFENYSKPTFSSKSIDAGEFKNEGNSFTTSYIEKNFKADEAFSFIIPSSNNRNSSICENIDGVKYFQITRSIENNEEIEFNPNKLTILWDCSFSAENKNLEKEIEFLKEYFNQIENCRVEFVTFNYKIKAKKEFSISGGDIESLLNEIKKVNYDGGSEFSCINNYETNSNAILLFSDGISSLGSSTIFESKVPVYSINSNLKANIPYLKQLSLSRGGVLVNLAFEETEPAVQKLRYKQMRLISAIFNSDIKEVYPAETADLSNDLTLCGILNTGSTANLTLNFGYGNEITKTETVIINADDEIESGLLARLWAKKKLDYLNIDPKKNKQEIFELGSKYGIVTPNTSLIILENARDYSRYNITPPKEDEKLYTEFEKMNSWKQSKPAENEVEINERYQKQIINEFKDRIAWYKKSYGIPKVEKITDTVTVLGARSNNSTCGTARSRTATTLDTNVREDLSSIIGLTSGVSNSGDGWHIRGGRSSETTVSEEVDALASPVNTQEIRVMANLSISSEEDVSYYSESDVNVSMDAFETMSDGKANRNHNLKSTISLTAYKSDAEYYAEIEKSPNTLEKYCDYKKDNKMSIGFYVDISEILSAKNRNSEAAEIITNIAELSEENQEYLRLVAYKLQYLGELDLAIKLFEYIKEIRGEEPQSYRDLALAYEEKGNYQAACDLLYECAFKKWNERFNSIAITSLTEMNIIISNHKDKVNTSKYNQEVIYPMPLDIRVVLKWDLDNTDIDLWVTDPKKEKCYYEHTRTRIGGLLPRDYTGGYGPEEFLLKNAIEGSYNVQANYFGSNSVKMSGGVTLFLELYTNYGKPNQTKKTIIQRLKTNKEVVNIADFEFKK